VLCLVAAKAIATFVRGIGAVEPFGHEKLHR
jgi:hypothetical protein